MKQPLRTQLNQNFHTNTFNVSKKEHTHTREICIFLLLFFFKFCYKLNVCSKNNKTHHFSTITDERKINFVIKKEVTMSFVLFVIIIYLRNNNIEPQHDMREYELKCTQLKNTNT